jgi:hypothetical protein
LTTVKRAGSYRPRSDALSRDFDVETNIPYATILSNRNFGNNTVRERNKLSGKEEC